MGKKSQELDVSEPGYGTLALLLDGQAPPAKVSPAS